MPGDWQRRMWTILYLDRLGIGGDINTIVSLKVLEYGYVLPMERQGDQLCNFGSIATQYLFSNA